MLDLVLKWEPLNHIDLLFNLHRGQEVEFAIVALELGVELIRLVLLLRQDNHLAAIVAHSEIFARHIKSERRDPII